MGYDGYLRVLSESQNLKYRKGQVYFCLNSPRFFFFLESMPFSALQSRVSLPLIVIWRYGGDTCNNQAGSR